MLSVYPAGRSKSDIFRLKWFDSITLYYKPKFSTVTSHTGKDDSLDTSNVVTYGIVLKLVEGLEHKENHLQHVSSNNYYTSPALLPPYT